MSNLVPFNNDGIEVIVNTETGEAFASQAGYARMSGINPTTIRKRVQRAKEGGDISELKTAEIPTKQGIQGVTLIPASLCYKWAFKDNPELAYAMGTAGATVYLYGVAGYEVKPVEKPIQKQPALPQNYEEALEHLLTQVKRNNKLQAANCKLAAQKRMVEVEKEKLEPVAKIGQILMNTTDSVKIGDFAKRTIRGSKGIGQNQLFKLLRDRKVLQEGKNHNRAYTSYLRAGWFEEKTTSYWNQRTQTNQLAHVTLITPKGIQWLCGKDWFHAACGYEAGDFEL